MASMVRIVLHRIPSGKLTPPEPLAASSFDSHTQIEFSCGGGLRNCNSQAIFRRRRRRGTSSLPGARGRRMDIQTRIYQDVCVWQAYVMQTAEELEKDDRTSVQPKRTNERESAAAADSAAAAA